MYSSIVRPKVETGTATNVSLSVSGDSKVEVQKATQGS